MCKSCVQTVDNFHTTLFAYLSEKIKTRKIVEQKMCLHNLFLRIVIDLRGFVFSFFVQRFSSPRKEG